MNDKIQINLTGREIGTLYFLLAWIGDTNDDLENYHKSVLDAVVSRLPKSEYERHFYCITEEDLIDLKSMTKEVGWQDDIERREYLDAEYGPEYLTLEDATDKGEAELLVDEDDTENDWIIVDDQLTRFTDLWVCLGRVYIRQYNNPYYDEHDTTTFAG